MRVFATFVFGLAALSQPALSQQDLISNLSKYPQASTFASLIQLLPGGLTALLPAGSSPNSAQGVTILVPNNDAFAKFASASNVTDITKLSPDVLLPILKYHILAARLTGSNFTAPDGLFVPTLLRDQQYNNRTAGAALVNTYGADAALGQVVYVSKDPISPVMFRVRDTQSVSLRGGDALGASLDPVDGTWDYGFFQIIDTVLVPPKICSLTVRGQQKLSNFDNVMLKTGLWAQINTTPNVTCLVPDNAAFAANANVNNMNSTELTGVVMSHTLSSPLYSKYLTSGSKIPSMAGPGFDVTVVKSGNDIYFNDAKVVAANVLTNNGLIHVLDKFMSPNGTAPTGSSTTSSPTATSTTSTGATSSPSASQSSKPNAAGGSGTSGAAPALLAFFVAVGVLY